MASHQLRTPLTSMKGYLSMVLDGDYGEVTEEQRSALQRSFSSAQRMVYMVADLLNVSRLKSGKFIISNQPTDLSKLANEEVAQLQEEANLKRIKVTLLVHDAIPIVQLDEVKIRQVVMNFLDNALYYTPNDGRVEVNLSCKNDIVTFTITDTGLGVPLEEQANLFQKFYRASNARKSRPDGTGLGLYMAAKVIGAQGGKLLFVSKEGVGSTFGFSVPVSLEQVAASSIPATAPSNTTKVVIVQFKSLF